MKKLIIMAALAVAAFGFSEASAQKVIKDASGKVYIDAQEMPAGTFSTATLNKVDVTTGAGNTLFKKLQIAKNDLPAKMNWATALGLADSYNTVTALNQTQGTANTGCKAYTEDGISGWRVPTMRELQLMWIMNPALSQAGIVRVDKDRHVSSTENLPTTCDWLSGSYSANQPKTSLMTVRCVREVN